MTVKIRAKSTLKLESETISANWEFPRGSAVAQCLVDVIQCTSWNYEELDEIEKAVRKRRRDMATNGGPADPKPLVLCAAASDGECNHPECPQLRDNEPEATGRHCPLDTWDDPE